VFSIVRAKAIYSYADDGITWTEKSELSLVGGAVVSLVSDGTTLYTVSNRNAVFKSVDNGSTWTQITINYTQAQVLGLDFAAVGNTMAFCAVNLGSFISSDGGVNWVLKNPSIAIGTVQAHNNEIYGTTFGMFKLVNNNWTKIASGFPGGLGITAGTKASVSMGTKIFTYYYDIITQSAKIFVSDNNGSSWSEAGNNLPTAITSSLNNFLAATPEYLYCYISSSQTVTGVYRIKINSTSAIEDENISSDFSLEQNYPNPFNPETTISYTIPSNVKGETINVTLKVYDVLGREIASLVDEFKQPGIYNSTFSTLRSPLTSGIYFYTLKAGSFSSTKKMLLIK
ncbi:MAG: T9SS type A sorting domain-containing protein, partial [Ignavibacteria bacterium]|nr:T9SS type A sorting domain-containing protein [Ignavibacteria bacterium]